MGEPEDTGTGEGGGPGEARPWLRAAFAQREAGASTEIPGVEL